jgi:hypothetical protein
MAVFINGIGTAAPARRYSQRERWLALQGSSRFPTLAPRSRAILRKVLTGDNGQPMRALRASGHSRPQCAGWPVVDVELRCGVQLPWGTARSGLMRARVLQPVLLDALPADDSPATCPVSYVV